MANQDRWRDRDDYRYRDDGDPQEFGRGSYGRGGERGSYAGDYPRGGEFRDWERSGYGRGSSWEGGGSGYGGGRDFEGGRGRSYGSDFTGSGRPRR